MKLAGNKNRRVQKYPPQFDSELTLGDCAHGANASTAATIQAGVCVDFKLAVTLADSAYRALACTSTARNALVADFVSHSILLFLRIIWISLNSVVETGQRQGRIPLFKKIFFYIIFYHILSETQDSFCDFHFWNRAIYYRNYLNDFFAK